MRYNRLMLQSDNTSDEKSIETFYKELFSHVRCIPKNNVLIINGDMNAHTYKSKNNKFYLQNSPNRNEEFSRKWACIPIH